MNIPNIPQGERDDGWATLWIYGFVAVMLRYSTLSKRVYWGCVFV